MNKPLRIGLLMQGSRDWIGGAEYIKNLILALGNLPAEVRSTYELYLICSKSTDPDLLTSIRPYLNKIYYQEVELAPATVLNRLQWKLKRTLFDISDPPLDTFINKIKLDFVYPRFNQGRGKSAYASAAWIPDFQHKYLTQFFTEAELQKREQNSQRIAKYAEAVVFSSQSVAADFQKFYPQAAHKAQILSFKTSTAPQWYQVDPVITAEKYKLSDRFFLVSNQFWQHKNHLLIFAALKTLKERDIYPVVACTGLLSDYRQPEYSKIITQTIEDFGLQKQVHLLGLIPKIDQIQLMRRCIAVIQPSLFEGWSTVVEDARVFGRPTILSDIPVHIEQNPPNSVFFERNSCDRLAAVLADCWQKLTPGPDLQQEAESKIDNLVATQAFGNNFIQIAKKIVSST